LATRVGDDESILRMVLIEKLGLLRHKVAGGLVNTTYVAVTLRARKMIRR
jgi:hypothetical protein